MSGRIVILLIYVAMWAGVTGSVAPLNLLFGLALGLLALWLVRDPSDSGPRVHPLLVLQLAGVFIIELLKSGIRVARIVVRPDMKLRPAVIAYPLTVTRDFEITILASLITLTPGTLSVDVSRDGGTLYIHCVDVDDYDAVIADIRDTFESLIRRAFN